MLRFKDLSDGRLYRGMETAMDWISNLGILDIKLKDRVDFVKRHAFIENADGFKGLVVKSDVGRKNGSFGREYNWLKMASWLKGRSSSVVLEAGKEVFVVPAPGLSDMGIALELTALPGKRYESSFSLFSQTAKRRISLGTDIHDKPFVVERINGSLPRAILLDGQWIDGAEEWISFWNLRPDLINAANFNHFQMVFARFFEELRGSRIEYNQVMVWFNRVLEEELAKIQ